jgi:hypothetical protein
VGRGDVIFGGGVVVVVLLENWVEWCWRRRVWNRK